MRPQRLSRHFCETRLLLVDQGDSSVQGVAVSLLRVPKGSDTGPAGVQVTIAEAATEAYNSARALAVAFGSVLLAPTWWPDGVEEINYRLDPFPHRSYYRIGSIRHDGVPICVIGSFEVPGAGRATGEWHEP